MLHEYVLPKPAHLRGYPLHRMVAGLTQGAPSIFADVGDRLLIRTAATLEADALPLPHLHEGELRAFELRACVSKKRKGKHLYPHRGDWAVRHDWLRRQGERHGFDVLTVHCTADTMTIDNGSGRRFSVDQTDFTGVLRVIDLKRFNAAMLVGIGSVSRTYGFDYLIIT